jgi:hypothetical protein
MAKQAKGTKSSLPCQGGSPRAISASSEPAPQIDVTPQMVEAGVAVLYWAEGEASKEVTAKEVFLAMAGVAGLLQKSC